MKEFLGTGILGLVCIFLGLQNRKGNLSTLHSYHRKRVKEEDVLPYGKQVGLGTILCGAGLIVYGALSALWQSLQLQWLFTLRSVALIGSIVIGMAINVRAMIKYNKGIF